jgi:hypothetical protein
MVLKLHKADAATDDAHKQIDYTMQRLIQRSVVNLRRIPGMKSEWLEELKSYADEYSRWQEARRTGKRCCTVAAEAAAETSCGDEDSSDASWEEEDSRDASSEVCKKARH